MNEQIEKLAEQAFSFASAADDSDESDANWWNAYNEKFAELIVRECIKLCDGNHEYKNNTDTLFGGGIAAGVEICKTQIAQHFGVE